ncbi:MAG: hypothetical protein ACYDB0_13535 [Acidithiobacillus sp.]
MIPIETSTITGHKTLQALKRYTSAGQNEGEKMAMKFVVCVNKEGLGDLSGEDVTVGGTSMKPSAMLTSTA